jgi:transcriptional regulator with XRE-family HTH domain
VVAVIAESVRHHRKLRGMSAQQLADSCSELGYSGMTRSVIANLETGARDSLSVPEWLILAAGLQVPPLLLLYPLGRTEDTIEVLPGVQLSPWEGLVYAETGQHRVGQASEEKTIQLFRSHHNRVRQWRRATAELRDIERVLAGEARTVVKPRHPSLRDGDPDPADDQRHLAAARTSLATNVDLQIQGIRLLRDAIKGLGLMPPPLPPGLRHLDASDTNDTEETTAWTFADDS